jgi:FMN phosphatase YigB (HAD superfamily)
MLHAVLFDLDNTLILFDEDKFFGSYLQAIPEYFRDIMPPEEFQKKLLFATRELANNNGEMSNLEYFMKVLSAGYEEKQALLWQRFRDFYATEFDQFQHFVSVPNGVRQLFEQLQQIDLKLVIASHPLFPENIQLKRVFWAGLEEIEFDLITDIENMTYCKPRREYYREICEKIKVRPEHCLMVGNDPVNDMVAGEIGMKTFLVNNSGATEDLSVSEDLRKFSKTKTPGADFEGQLSDVPEVIQRLQSGE